MVGRRCGHIQHLCPYVCIRCVRAALFRQVHADDGMADRECCSSVCFVKLQLIYSDILFPSILMQQLSESLFLGAAARCFCNFVLYKSTRGNVGCLPCSNFSVATLKGSSRSVMSFMKTLLQLSISELPLSSMIFSISWNCVYADFSIPTLEFHCVLASWHTP